MVVPINYFAVLVAGVIPMIVGMIWYSPALFTKRWMALVGKTEEELKQTSPAKAYALSFVTSLVMSYCLAHSVIFGSAYMNVGGAAAGMQAGFWSWLGFVVTTNLAPVLFEFRPVGLYYINMGYQLVCMLAMGALLGAWV